MQLPQAQWHQRVPRPAWHSGTSWNTINEAGFMRRQGSPNSRARAAAAAATAAATVAALASSPTVTGGPQQWAARTTPAAARAARLTSNRYRSSFSCSGLRNWGWRRGGRYVVSLCDHRQEEVEEDTRKPSSTHPAVHQSSSSTSSAVALPDSPASARKAVWTPSLFVILFVSCLNLLGYTMLAPLTPGMVTHFSLQSEASIGLMASAFGFGRLCATAVWPALSDVVGTKPVLTIALIGSMFGIFLQAFAILLGFPFTTFLLARVLTGLFSGIVPVMKAYIVRSFSAADVPRIFAYRDAAATVAFVLGPIIGGTCAKCHLSLPLFLAAGACGQAALMVTRYLEEIQVVKAPPKESSPLADKRSSKGRFLKALGMPIPPLVLSFTWACTRTCFHAYYPWMLAQRGGTTFTVVQIGSILTGLSLFMGLVQLLAFELCERRLGLRGTMVAGGFLIGAGLLGLSASPTMLAFMTFSVIYGIGGALLSPAASAFLVRVVPAEHCGALLGIDSAVTNFGRIVAPPIFGMLYGMGALRAAAAAMVMATLPAVLVGGKEKKWVAEAARQVLAGLKLSWAGNSRSVPKAVA